MAYLTFFLALVFLIFPTSHSLPFIFFHGLLDECANDQSTVEMLKNASGVEGECLEINDNRCSSLFVPLKTQIDKACEKVKGLEYLREGFNIVAVSQGTLIARGLLQFCDGAPPVKNFISLAGPHAGVGKIPEGLCILLELIHVNCSDIENVVYTKFVQELLTVATIYKSPLRIPEYLANSQFLPDLNNERPEARNQTYKDRFSSLDNLVLLMNEDDRLLNPKETAWFGYYKDGSYDPIPAEETDLYIEDWIGLRTLTETGKVKRHTVKGGHANLTEAEAKAYVVPYLKNYEPSKSSVLVELI